MHDSEPYHAITDENVLEHQKKLLIYQAISIRSHLFAFALTARPSHSDPSASGDHRGKL